jgi:trigger factor
LKIETKDLEKCQVEMIVAVDQDQLNTAMRSAAKRLSKGTKIAGFRPGKAPYDVVRSRFGEEVLFDEAMDTLGQDIYREALEDTQIEPYAPGKLEEIVTREPLVLRFSVPTSPKVDLGQYRDIRIDFEESEVTDQAVEDFLEEMRQNQALIEPVEREVKLGDLVVIDLHGELTDPEEDEDPLLLDEKGSSLVLEEGTDWPFEGFAEYLVEKNADEQLEIEHEFPPDYQNEGLRGKTARFTVSILEVKSRLVPEWSDDLAQNLGDFESLLDLRVKVREGLQEQADRNNQNEYSRRAVDEVVAGSSIEYPDVILEQETADMLREMEARLQAQNLTMENYLQITQQNQEELEKELEPQAEERVARALVLGKVIDVEGINIEESDIDDSLNSMLESVDDSNQALRQAFDTPAGRARIAMDLLTEKAVNRLAAIARGEAPPLEIQDEEKQQPNVSENGEIEQQEQPESEASTTLADDDSEANFKEEQVKDDE